MMVVVVMVVTSVVSVAVPCQVAWLAAPEAVSFAVPSGSYAMGLFYDDRVAHYGLATHLLDGPLGVRWAAKLYEREPVLYDRSSYVAAFPELFFEVLLGYVVRKVSHVNPLRGNIVSELGVGRKRRACRRTRTRL